MSSKRKNDTAFIHASRVAKLIRTVSCCGPIYMKPDRSRYHLLVQFIYQEILENYDDTSAGKRRLSNEDICLLEGYEMDFSSLLCDCLHTKYSIEFNQYGSYIHIKFPSLIPALQIISPQGATHCKLTAVAATMDLNNYNAVVKSAQSPMIHLTHEPVNNLSIKVEYQPAPDQPIFIILGISFIDTMTAKTGNPQYSQSVRIIKVEINNAPLYNKKSSRLYNMDFNEEASF